MGNTQECQFELSKVLSRKMEEKSLLSFPKFCTIKKHMEYSWIKSFCLLIGANSCLCFHYLIIAMKYFLAFIIITSRAASKTACWTLLFALMNLLYKWIISILRSGWLCTSSITATEGGHFTPKSCWRCLGGSWGGLSRPGWVEEAVRLSKAQKPEAGLHSEVV